MILNLYLSSRGGGFDAEPECRCFQFLRVERDSIELVTSAASGSTPRGLTHVTSADPRRRSSSCESRSTWKSNRDLGHYAPAHPVRHARRRCPAERGWTGCRAGQLARAARAAARRARLCRLRAGVARGDAQRARPHRDRGRRTQHHRCTRVHAGAGWRPAAVPPFPEPQLPTWPWPIRWLIDIWRWRWWPWWWFSFRCMSRARAQQVFDAMAATTCNPLTVPPPCIPFMYPDDGCWGRAHEMCRLMINMGVKPAKVWIDASDRC